jgi:CelD/BcsL family acetyltransferase involved in cellulose biosynthesis
MGTLAQSVVTDAESLTTTAIHDVRAFDELASEWDDLVEHSDQRVFFLRPRWNQLWWKYHAPPGSRLHLIVCRDRSHRLVGLAPLYWRPRPTFGLKIVRELSFLGMGVACKTSEHLDVIARRGAEEAVARALASALRQTHWDRLWLWQVPCGSNMLQHLVAALDWRARVEVCDRAPYIDTSTDWATFKAGLGRSMRRNVEYYTRRLFKKYAGCHFERVTTADQLETAMDALVQLHQARWQAKGQPGAFSPAFEAFLRDAMRDALHTSRLALWTLTIDGRIEAALVGFTDNGVLHYFQKGFNPAFEKDDLGTVMLALSLRACFDDPTIRSFDFMGGGAAYKDMWARQSRETLVCEVDRPTLGSALLGARALAGDVARGVYRRLVPTGLRAWRRDRLRRRLLKTRLDEAALAGAQLSD